MHIKHKKVKRSGIKYKDCEGCLEYTNIMLIRKTFIDTTSINLFCGCKNVFTNMNSRMIKKNSKKHHYLKKEDFYYYLNIEDIANADYMHVERVL